MSDKKTKKCTAAVFAAIGALSLAGGALAWQEPAEAKAEAQKLYSADFETLQESATADEIYAATGIAGTTRSVVQSVSSYIEAPYTFYDNGCQQATLYLDSGRGVNVTDVSKTYTISMLIQPYGRVASTVLGITGADTAAYNSVVTLNDDGTSSASNYGTEKYVNLVSASKTSDGWWSVELTARGTGGFIFFQYFMNTTDYQSANAQNDTGLRVAKFSAVSGDTVIYELNVVSGLTGNQIYDSCGFAGISAASTITGSGVENKALKSVYEFFSTAEGGWQKEPLYINENWLNVTMQTGKKYIVEYDVRLFGKVDQAICLYQQMGQDTDSQVIMKADGTYQTAEYKELKMFDDVAIAFRNGVFRVKATINGLGGLFKFEMRMHSSDADSANTAKDTGVYFDNFAVYDVTETTEEEADPTEGEYTKIFGQNFDGVDSSVSGSDAMFHASGFAGLSTGVLTIDEQGIDGSKALKGVYDFFTTAEGGWQKENLYLNSGVTSGTATEKVYKISMDVKPFGRWDTVYIGFQTPAYSTDYIRLNADGTSAKETDANILIRYSAAYDNGVFSIEAYLYGTGGYIFNFFNMHSSDADGANTAKDTGILLDNYVFAEKKAPETPSLNKKITSYNKATETDFVTFSNLAAISEVSIGERTLTAEEYTYANGLLTVKESVMKQLPEGENVLSVKSGDGAEVNAVIYVMSVLTGADYVTDFSEMPVLTGDQNSKDEFYRSSFMDPGAQSVYTEDENGNRMIKFVSLSTETDDFTSMFQTNPQNGRLNSFVKDKWHTLTVDFKPVNASLLRLRCNIFDNGNDTNWWTMQLDLAAGRRTDENEQSRFVYFTVTPKENGWYQVSVSFFFTGEEYSATASAYIVFSSAKENENTVWYMDNLEADSELIPGFIDDSPAGYDTATEKEPYRLIQLYTFTVTKVTADGRELSAEDYTVTKTPVGTYRLTFSKEFCKQYNEGDTVGIDVYTSKGNVLSFELGVYNSTPVLPSSPIEYDKALKKDASAEISLAGFDVAGLETEGSTVAEGAYYIDGDKLVIKHSYLKTFAAGLYVFVLETTSGAKGQFTVQVSDTTPVLQENVSYKKASGALTIDAELYGKEIVSVKIGETILTTEQYSYTDGQLTICADVMNALIAGEYSLTVETTAETETTIAVNDEPPVFENKEYTAKQGEEFTVKVDVKGKNVISVTVDGLVLNADEYTLENGTLTIQSAVFDEIAAGSRTLKLTTEGGSAELIFTLEEKEAAKENKGCSGIASGAYLPLTAAAFVVAALSKKRKNNGENGKNNRV